MSVKGALERAIDREIKLQFERRTVDDVRQFEASTRRDIEEKRQELRKLVADHYRDLIDSADSIVLMRDSSQQLLSRLGTLHTVLKPLDAASMRVNTVLDEQSKVYTEGKLVKTLVDTPERIWQSLEDNHYLRATKEYLVAKQVYERITDESNGSKTLASMPLLARQWSTIAQFPRKITHKARQCLVSSITNDLQQAEALCAIVLLEPRKTRALSIRIFEEYLEARKLALKSLFEHVERDDVVLKVTTNARDVGSSIERVFVTVADVLKATLYQVEALFLDVQPFMERQRRDLRAMTIGGRLWRGPSQNVSLITILLMSLSDDEQYFTDATDLVADTWSLGVEFSTESARAAASIAVPSFQDLQIMDTSVHKLMSQWLAEVAAVIKSNGSQILSSLDTCEALATVQEAIVKRLHDDSATQWHRCVRRVCGAPDESGESKREGVSTLNLWSFAFAAIFEQCVRRSAERRVRAFPAPVEALLDSYTYVTPDATQQRTHSGGAQLRSVSNASTESAPSIGMSAQAMPRLLSQESLSARFAAPPSALKRQHDDRLAEDDVGRHLWARQAPSATPSATQHDYVHTSKSIAAGITPIIAQVIELVEKHVTHLLADIRIWYEVEQERQKAMERRGDIDEADRESSKRQWNALQQTIFDTLVASLIDNLFTQRIQNVVAANACTPALIGEALLLGRACRALARHCDSLRLLLGLSDEPPRVSARLARHFVAIESASLFSSLHVTLMQHYVCAHLRWIEALADGVGAALRAAFAAETFDDAHRRRQCWQQVRVGSGKDEESVEIPYQASAYIQLLLFRLCTDIHAGGAHGVEACVLLVLVSTCASRCADEYERLLGADASVSMCKEASIQCLLDTKVLFDTLSMWTHVHAADLALLRGAATLLPAALSSGGGVLQHYGEQFDAGEDAIRWRRRINALQERLKSQLDPIDLAFYEPHIARCAARQLQRQSQLFGFLGLNTSEAGAADSSASKRMKLETQDQHQIMALAPPVARFARLPLGDDVQDEHEDAFASLRNLPMDSLGEDLFEVRMGANGSVDTHSTSPSSSVGGGVTALFRDFFRKSARK